MALKDVQNAATANQGQMTQDRSGNFIPKNKIINDANHVYNPQTDQYEPETPADRLKAGIMQAGQSLWQKLGGGSGSGSGSQ